MMKPTKLPVILYVDCPKLDRRVPVDDACREPCDDFRGVHSTGHVLCDHSKAQKE